MEKPWGMQGVDRTHRSMPSRLGRHLRRSALGELQRQSWVHWMKSWYLQYLLCYMLIYYTQFVFWLCFLYDSEFYPKYLLMVQCFSLAKYKHGKHMPEPEPFSKILSRSLSSQVSSTRIQVNFSKYIFHDFYFALLWTLHIS